MAVNRATVYLESNQEEISSKTVNNTRMDLKHIPSYIIPEKNIISLFSSLSSYTIWRGGQQSMLRYM